VPMLQCGLLRSNFALPMFFLFRLYSALAISLRRVSGSTGFISLPGFARRGLERVKGIEPSSSAWKAVALPLSYTRLIRLPSHTQCGHRGPPRIHSSGIWRPDGRKMVEGGGFEPP
jgi:hypothetical protein